MNTQNNLVVAEDKKLPPLIKQSSTYKLIVPRKVEEKIRYLCRKFPTLEWSGVLFTTHQGNFEDNNLVITCQDIYPMDLGSPGFTQFKMDETVAGYIADNLDLFDADISLVHSHNQMSAFFSGQDQATLRDEGNDKNCFVSLIVNNAGTYCAAVTRKIQKKTEVVTRSLGTSYQFFGDGAVVTDEDPMSERTEVVDREVIEYFMLDVEVEKVDNPLAYLDTRFEEIEAKKKADAPFPNLAAQKQFANYTPGKVVDGKIVANDEDDDKEFYSWIHSERNKAGEAKEALLFDEDTMNEMMDATKWQPDPTIIHHLVVQLITCSLIVSPEIDLKQWITKHMDKKYFEIFGSDDGTDFGNWCDSYVEFILNHYSDERVPPEVYDYWDEYISKIAMAIMTELEKYQSNSWIKSYNEVLNRYIV